MKTFILFSIILFFSIFPLISMDLPSFIQNSDRTSNDIIFEMLLSEETENKLIILKNLPLREDLYIEDILILIINRENSGFNKEFYLEILFESIFAKSIFKEEIKLWLRINPNGFRNLAISLSNYSNNYLKSYIIKLFSFSDYPDIKSYLMTEAKIVLNKIHQNNGLVSPGLKYEIIEIFNTIMFFDEIDFLEICISILEESRDQLIVELGKKTVSVLLE